MTTVTTTDTAIITPRSRNLGYGWTNSVHQTRNESGFERLVVDSVDEPGYTGSLYDIETAIARARRGNGENDWRSAFFVGGRKVTGVRVVKPARPERDSDGYPVPGFTNAWDDEFRPLPPSQIVSDLRAGAHLEVRF